MKYSQLDYSLLSKPENIDYVYELVMAGIKDYSKQQPMLGKNPDFLIVLGCSPIPIKSRVLKTIELYKKGYGKYILLTGGKGWHKISQKSEHNKQRMLNAVKEVINNEITGEKITAKEEKILQKYTQPNIAASTETHEQQVEKKMLKLTEVQLMQKVFYSLGEIPPIKVFHEPFSKTTLENVKFSEKLLSDLQKRGEVPKINRVMIITSCFHCRRSILTFRKRFPKDVEILACPGTYDLTSIGMNLSKEDLLSDKNKNGYYKKQIYNELDALINYSKNGTIADADISEFVGEDMAKKIKKLHEEIER